MSGIKEIKRRIKSISNTKQIIKAMELVSVVKMQKAVSVNLSSRKYSDNANIILTDIIRTGETKKHPLVVSKSGEKSLVLVVTSDRGLAGSLNIKTIKETVDKYGKDLNADFISIGKKGRDFLKNYGFNVIAEFNKISEKPEYRRVLPIIHLAKTEFLSGKYKEVVVVYPHFVSTLVQKSEVVKLLPFEVKETEGENMDRVIFEPDKDIIINTLIPRVLEINLWQIILEAVASEHSARMVSMKSANENAGDLIDDLTLTFNQNRQANITRELAEISAGKMTLEG
ncbi:ATP synthase F1 subunit gamma [bacterium]|nr:ATP synthase F1 subunit gamma [bacterium]